MRGEKRSALLQATRQALEASAKLVEEGEAAEARRIVGASLSAALEARVLDEAGINRLGYDELQAGRVAPSVAVFQFNAETFPESSNVWDSLGEALMEQGEYERAIQHYQKSLELDPGNSNATEMIRRMRAR